MRRIRCNSHQWLMGGVLTTSAGDLQQQDSISCEDYRLYCPKCVFMAARKCVKDKPWTAVGLQAAENVFTLT